MVTDFDEFWSKVCKKIACIYLLLYLYTYCLYILASLYIYIYIIIILLVYTCFLGINCENQAKLFPNVLQRPRMELFTISRRITNREACISREQMDPNWGPPWNSPHFTVTWYRGVWGTLNRAPIKTRSMSFSVGGKSIAWYATYHFAKTDQQSCQNDRVAILSKLLVVHNLFGISLIYTNFGFWLYFSDWFGTNRN